MWRSLRGLCSAVDRVYKADDDDGDETKDQFLIKLTNLFFVSVHFLAIAHVDVVSLLFVVAVASTVVFIGCVLMLFTILPVLRHRFIAFISGIDTLHT